MSLAVYVHIPYCLQRCRYCDFTTFEWKEILPPEKYVDLIRREIGARHAFWPDREVSSLYFGGGTPSLIEPELIVAIRDELAKVGFVFRTDTEITIEINPATISAEKLDVYARAGINRYSVGAQTFDDDLLKMCGRRHSADDTRATLKLLRDRDLNYSFDLLFALPGQTEADVQRDLDEVSTFSPPHLSAYCLTVPESHPMSRGRAPEDDQVRMFATIERHLAAIGLRKYEISNFARPGMESRHNSTYWADRNYWGIGLSSHSYDRDRGGSGLRFWNPKSLVQYEAQVDLAGRDFTEVLPPDQFEALAPHEALTDFCHMFLRTAEGLGVDALRDKFAGTAFDLTHARLDGLVARGLLAFDQKSWRLTTDGELISNRVFEDLTFLAGTLTRSAEATYCAL